MEYFNHSVEVLDYVDSCNISYAVLEEHLIWLGYPMGQHIIYWCRPGKTIPDGMVRIRGNEELQQMFRASAQHKVLEIIADNSDFTSNFKQDLVLKISIVESPVRISNSNAGAVSAISSHILISVNV
ncbi:hypothetical protein D1007_35160 [Hordeum vulgare]|nr:hypothetical protein D1007_35160 [Hordeum vulgare]